MTAMTRDEIGARLAALISNSDDANESEAHRKDAMDYYFMRPRGDESQGRSKVVSGDLSSMTEAVLSQMLDAFTTDNAIEFEPNSKEDEQQAQLESDVVSFLVMEANNGYVMFAEAIKDALLLRNGLIKIWVEETKTVTQDTFDNVSPEAFVELTKGTNEIKVDVIIFTDDHLEIRSTKIVRALTAEAIPPENFILTQGWDRLDLHDVPFCAEIKNETRSSLIEQGFSKKQINDMPADDLTIDTSRNPREATPSNVVPDTSQDIIKVHEVYVLMDVDGDGISERRRMIYANSEVLDNEIVETVPYAAGSVFIAPHRFLGISLFDKLKQTQDITTGLTRAMLDNANATNKSRLAYRKGAVDMDMLEDGRVNGLIECDDPQTDLRALVVPDISAGILQNIEHQKRTRSEMGGASLELATGQAQLGSNQVGSEGLDRAYTVMEQLAAMMAKNIAETLVKQTFLIAHATLRENFDQPLNIRVGGRWNTAIPSDWEVRKRINIKIGMSAGERNRKISALGEIINKQTAVAEQGGDGVLVDIDGTYNALIDWARASEIDNPERYWVDPTTDESKQALKDKQDAEAMSEQQRSNLLARAIDIENLKIAFDKYKQDTDLKFKYRDIQLKSEVEEAKIVGKATQDLQNVQIKAGHKADTGAETETSITGAIPVAAPGANGIPDGA